MLPLCEISVTPPAGRGTSTSPQSAAAPWKETSPSQSGPSTGISRSRGRELVLQCSRAGLGEARREHDGGAAATARGGPDHAGNAGRGDRDHDRVDRLGEVVERRDARPSVHLAARRMNAPDGTGEPERGEVAQRRVPRTTRPGRSPRRRRPSAGAAAPRDRAARSVARRRARQARSAQHLLDAAALQRAGDYQPLDLARSLPDLSTRNSRRNRSATLSRL